MCEWEGGGGVGDDIGSKYLFDRVDCWKWLLLSVRGLADSS